MPLINDFHNCKTLVHPRQQKPPALQHVPLGRSMYPMGVSHPPSLVKPTPFAHSHSEIKFQKSAKNLTKKFVKLTDHNYACNSLTKWSEWNKMAGNGHYVNLLKLAWEKFAKSNLTYFWRVLAIWNHCCPQSTTIDTKQHNVFFNAN